MWLLAAGCASSPGPTRPAPHKLPAAERTSRNQQRLDGSYYEVERGDTLWRIAHAFGLEVNRLADANQLADSARLDMGRQLFVPLPQESARFLWPVRGRYQPATGSTGLRITTSNGALVRASRTGRVTVAAHRLSGWGQTIILDHEDGYVSIYAGLEELFAVPGRWIRQGMPVGRLGRTDLHFEIRHAAGSRDTLALLPQS